MLMLAVPVAFCRGVAQPTHVEKIGRARLKFEWSEIAVVQGRSVGPDAADAVFFQQMNELWAVPAGMPKLDGKAKIPRQLLEERSQRDFPLFRLKGRWQLDQDDVQLGCKRFDR